MKRCSYYLILTLCLAGISIPQSKNDQKSVQNTNVNWAQRALQGYNMRVWISNQIKMGLQAWDCGSQDCIPVEPHMGLEYPAGSGVEHLYGLGIRIGGKVNGAIHVSVGYDGSDARSEFYPSYYHLPRWRFWQTSVNSIGEPNKRYCDDDGDGKVDEDDLDGTDNDGDWNPSNDDVGADGLVDPVEISCDGMPYDPNWNPDPAGDNYDPGTRDKCHPNKDGSQPFKNNRDRWLEKNGLPDHGEPHVDEDYAAISDNDLYCSATDTFSRPVWPGHVPMGLMCIQKSYAWRGRYLEAVLPFEYSFVNIGQDTITDIYVGYFADMELGPTNIGGYWQHNYSAYIDSLRTAFIHNPVDRGSTPLGLTILGSPKPLDSLRFIYRWRDYSLIGDEPCNSDSCLYAWMNGAAFPGQPIQPNQEYLSDTRIFFSFGPFEELKPGDTLKTSMALVSGYGVDQGVNSLTENAKKAIMLYNNGYISPVMPISPELDVAIKPNRAELKWHPSRNAVGNGIVPSETWDDSNKLAESFPDDHWRRTNPPCGNPTGECTIHKCDENGKLPGGRTFTGFRLYRSEDVGSVPQEESFVLMHEYLLPDTSTEWSLAQMDTTFIDSNLVYGKRYWYAVTSIGLPDITVVKVPMPDGSTRYDTLYSEYSESSLRENWVKVDMSFLPSEEPGKVLVVPNPYRTDQKYSFENGGWEGHEWFWDENMRLVKFIHLPKGEWTIRIFTLVGEKVTVIKNTISNGYEEGGKWIEGYREDRGEISYRLVNESGRALASGVYLYIVDSDLGQQTGKFVVIR